MSADACSAMISSISDKRSPVKSNRTNVFLAANRQLIEKIAFAGASKSFANFSHPFMNGSNASSSIGWKSASLLSAGVKDVSYVFIMAINCFKPSCKKSGGPKSWGATCDSACVLAT